VKRTIKLIKMETNWYFAEGHST